MTNKPEKPNVIWAANGTNTDPGDQLFEQGWPFTDGQGSPQPPESGVMNYIQNKSSQFLAHVNEYGIAQWDADTIYPIGAYASSSVTNRVYISTANNNQNNEKTNEKQPDYTGQGKIGGREVKIAGWKKVGQSGTSYISFKVEDKNKQF